MRFEICHEIRGRMRVRIDEGVMTFERADALQYFLERVDGVESVRVNERTRCAVVVYTCPRETVVGFLGGFSFDASQVPSQVLEMSGRAMDAEYRDRLISRVMRWAANRLFCPMPLRVASTAIGAAKYIARGVRTLARRKLEMPVLDAAAIGVSIARGEFSTAGAVMFLMDIGEILEEWTRKKSVGDLARSLSLNIDKVWAVRGGEEVLIPASEICVGDSVIVRAGSVIPFDGRVESGDASVNQASMTGESMPVHKSEGSIAYAGTVVEEGEIVLEVREVSGSGRFDKIVSMIEESERMKSTLESQASHLADRLVPYTLAGAGLMYLATGRATKALAVLMVDFSCALKLAIPLAVLSAIRDAGASNITVKGGKFLESVAEAKTIVFDKTGTLTRACPTVVRVESLGCREPNELLRMAACLEEHFPHSMARAVVDEARRRGIDHEEMHSKVEYIVAHGISSMIEGRRVVIGSHHFVFDDERCTVAPERQAAFDALPLEHTHLYIAVDGALEGAICIEDPLREEAASVIRELKELGVENVVMMTGDSERTARCIAQKAGVDRWFAEVLPSDKASFIESEKAAGRKVIMIGDGINDTPALSAADVGVAISDGAAIAREIADVTIGDDDLYGVLRLRRIALALMDRIHGNYRSIVGFNLALIALGVGGLIAPATSALLHNASTVAISLRSMESILPDEA